MPGGAMHEELLLLLKGGTQQHPKHKLNKLIAGETVLL